MISTKAAINKMTLMRIALPRRQILWCTLYPLRSPKKLTQDSNYLLVLYLNTVPKIAGLQVITASSHCEPLKYVNKRSPKCKCPSCDKIQIEENLHIGLSSSLPWAISRASVCLSAARHLKYFVTRPWRPSPVLEHYRAAFFGKRDRIFVNIFEPCLRKVFS